MLGDFLTGQLPEHPIAVDNTASVSWDLGHNDRYGTCVPTSVANLIRVVSRRLTGDQRNTSWDELMRWYRTQNPGFDPDLSWNDPRQDDDGMVIQDLLAWLAREGIILGFARLDPDDPEQVKASEWLFLGTVQGLDLQEAQQWQSVWDYEASGEWGGHAVMVPRYEPNGETCVTWGYTMLMTPRFLDRQRSEAWVILTRDHVQHPGFREGFDLPRFAAAYEAITGRQFPVDINSPTFDPIPPRRPWWQVLWDWLRHLFSR